MLLTMLDDAEGTAEEELMVAKLPVGDDAGVDEDASEMGVDTTAGELEGTLLEVVTEAVVVAAAVETADEGLGVALSPQASAALVTSSPYHCQML